MSVHHPPYRMCIWKKIARFSFVGDAGRRRSGGPKSILPVGGSGLEFGVDASYALPLHPSQELSDEEKK